MVTEIQKELHYDKPTVMRDRVEAVEAYFDSWQSPDINTALCISDQIDDPHKPLPSTIAIIPVAAHAEAGNIQRALGCYASQISAEPFAVHLHLNWPSGTADTAAIENSFEAVEASQATFPELDIRVSAVEYSSPTIGAIRRAAWNGTLASLYEQNPNISTAVGMNHDIDVMSMSPRYVSRTQRYYAAQDETSELSPFLQPACTVNRHAFDPSLPNISKAVYWTDFTSKMYNGGFEGGLIVPFATYAQRGGFQNSDRTYETRALTFEGQQRLERIIGTRLETSARRYHDRLPSNSYDTIWSDDTFSPHDACRTRTDFTDISDAELHLHLAEDAKHFPSYYVRHMLRDGLSSEQYTLLAENEPAKTELVIQDVLNRASKAARLTNYALARVIGADDVATYLVTHGFSEDSVRYEVSLLVSYLQSVDEYLEKGIQATSSPNQQ